MLSNIEHFFVRLLRGTVVATAFIAFLVAVAALLYAGYAQYAPEPQASLSRRIDKFRQEVDPAALIKQIFSNDSTVYKDANVADRISYERSAPSDEVLLNGINKFLDISLNASIERRQQFSDWLYGTNKIEFLWSRSIDDKDATNENNVNFLWRSLLNDYATRLVFRSQSLGAARKQRLYSTSFDKLAAPTGQSQAPYFLVWFFEKLQGELRAVDQELTQLRIERNLLRQTVPLALTVASGAFGYFIFIMFLFLVVSIEASVRHLAGVRTLAGSLAPPSQPIVSQAPPPPPAANATPI
jgi:hypothetical protein